MSNKEIREEIIRVFSEYHYTCSDIHVGNSYYLFDLGEENVVHFRIKGCKRWLFGLWIVDIGDNKTRISLFGEHEDYIDKFKPTQTKLSEEIEFSNDDESLKSKIEGLIWSFIYDKVDVIHSSNLGGKIKFYYHGLGKGVLRWLLKTWWFYRIKHPFRKWLKYNANKYVCMIICFILNIVYSKRLHATYKKTDYYSPAYEVYLNYKEGIDDDGIYKVYCHINGNVGFNKSIDVEHIPFGETRGIYFELKEK